MPSDDRLNKQNLRLDGVTGIVHGYRVAKSSTTFFGGGDMSKRNWQIFVAVSVLIGGFLSPQVSFGQTPTVEEAKQRLRQAGERGGYGRALVHNDSQGGIALAFPDRPSSVPAPPPANPPARFGAIDFDHDSARLLPSAIPTLDVLASAMQTPELTGLRFLIVGHTSSVGDDRYNLRLSNERARSVVSALVARGVSADRLFPEGKGEAEPIGGIDPEDGRNRRVELWRRSE
ncbi:OmpA family protein [Sandarakinorhabdus sp.]|uniref:OmpA family protein n=1 Tax=Sandarakinorhabdus sp. TaxID=1916663 RepID=UPI003F724F9D